MIIQNYSNNSKRDKLISVVKELCHKEPLKSTIYYANLQKIQLFLVGGAVRDIFLKREFLDYDFTLKCQNIENFVKNTALYLNGTFIKLHTKEEIYRIVIKRSKFVLDFSKMRGGTIEEDLFTRDFTINAIAIELHQNKPLRIIDPLNGINDLHLKSIEVVNDKVFRADPLRMLRAYRLAAGCNFNISDQTESLILKNKDFIEYISSERIRDELFKLLNNKNYLSYMVKMVNSSLLNKIFAFLSDVITIEFDDTPSNWEDVISICKDLHNKTLFFNTIFNVDRTNNEYGLILKLLAWIKIHPNIMQYRFMPEVFKKYLKLSRNYSKFLTDALNFSISVRDRATHKLMTNDTLENIGWKWGEFGIFYWLIEICHRLSHTRFNKYRSNVIILVNSWINEVVPRLREDAFINGNDVIELLGINSGKLVGEILSESKRLQYFRRIQNRDEALNFAKNYNQ